MFQVIGILLTSILFVNCSRYVNYLEKKDSKDYQIVLPKEENKVCENIDQDNIVHDSPFTLQEFATLLKIVDKFNFNIAEKGILLTAHQILTRPDATDWSSRTQIHVRIGNKQYHQEYGSFTSLPLYEALKQLEKHSFFNKSLSYYINLANRSLPYKLTMQEGLNRYFESKVQSVSLNNRLKEKYLKLGKPLQKGESFKKSKIYLPNINLKKRTKTKSKEVNPPLFSLSKGFNCSFDAKLYQKGIFLISNKPYQENSFGIIGPNGDYFFMITKKEKTNEPAYKGQEIFGQAPSSISPFCHYKNDGQEFTLMGFNSRDPGQLLYHLYNYQITEAKDPNELLNYIRFPRHQFLTSPSRLLYESHRGSDEQLRYFLSLDFPVYHAEALGTVYTLFTKAQKTTFIGDNRYRTFQSCLN